MIVNRRDFAAAWGALAGGFLLPGTAHASTALGLSLEQLVTRSSKACWGVPVTRQCEWITIQGSKRIITETRIVTEADLKAETRTQEELLVVTLGGRVGKIGQKVPGEAQLQVGRKCLVFLGDEKRSRRRVVALGQGHYPVKDDSDDVLQRSASLPHLVGPKHGKHAAPRLQRAIDVLHGKSIDQAADLIRGAR